MRVFKVVSVISEGKLVSYNWTDNFDNGLTLAYSIDEWTRPIIPNSKLFAFKDLESAKEFLPFPSFTSLIYEAEAKNAIVKENLVVSLVDIFALEMWQKNLKFSIHYGEGIAVPPGTVLCDEIKLIRKVN